MCMLEPHVTVTSMTCVGRGFKFARVDLEFNWFGGMHECEGMGLLGGWPLGGNLYIGLDVRALTLLGDVALQGS